MHTRRELFGGTVPVAALGGAAARASDAPVRAVTQHELDVVQVPHSIAEREVEARALKRAGGT